jgi:hypothetical protein
MGMIALGLAVGVVALITVAAQGGEQGQDSAAGSSFNPGPAGTLALYLWLERGGYPVTRLDQAGVFRDRLQEADVLWVINPVAPYNEAQAQAVVEWVAAGGTLALAVEGGFQLTPDALLQQLGVNLSPVLPGVAGNLPLQQPVFARPPVREVQLTTLWTLDMPDPRVVPLVSAGPNPVLATFRHGAGRVFVLSTIGPLVNAGLAPADNGPLAWNLAAQGRGLRQAFDEVHHGYGGSDLRTLLLSQAWGWALIYVGAMLLAFLLLRGQRLGPPQPADGPTERRGTMDYVRSLAGLFHRAGRTEWAAARYAAGFRRTLAAPYGFDPAAPPATLAAEVAAVRPEIDAAALRSVLERLDAATQPAARPAGGALLRLVQEAEGIRARLER